MNKHLTLLFILIVVFANGNVAHCQSGHTVKIRIPYKLGKERQLQIEVDKGRQPWRLEPIAVALAAIQANVNINIPFENCKQSSTRDGAVLVKCNNVKNYIVLLKQLIHPKGIWTATEIQIAE